MMMCCKEIIRGRSQLRGCVVIELEFILLEGVFLFRARREAIVLHRGSGRRS